MCTKSIALLKLKIDFFSHTNIPTTVSPPSTPRTSPTSPLFQIHSPSVSSSEKDRPPRDNIKHDKSRYNKKEKALIWRLDEGPQ